MSLNESQAAQVLVQALAKGQARGAYEIHESALTGAAYDAWGSDDDYLLTWLATPEVLNLTIVEIVPDAPPAPPADAPATVEEPV